METDDTPAHGPRPRGVAPFRGMQQALRCSRRPIRMTRHHEVTPDSRIPPWCRDDALALPKRALLSTPPGGRAHQMASGHRLRRPQGDGHRGRRLLLHHRGAQRPALHRHPRQRRQLLSRRVRPEGEEDEHRRRCQKEIGSDAKGFGAQAKIHTRNNVGASGKIYFGTKQGYPDKTEKREDYPGGYPMVYDPDDRQDEGLPHPGAAPRHQQHHPRRVARRGLHLDLLRPPPRARAKKPSS